jgi:molybdenum cofactor cytidylyltransferase
VAELALGSQLDEIVVVTGHQAGEVVAALAGLVVRTVYNADYAAGLSSSLRVGIDAVPPEASGAMILLGDQPLLTIEVINRLVNAYRISRAAIVAPWAAGRRGNPVLFGRELFGELQEVRGDEGARAVIVAHAPRLELVEVDGAVFEDVDTPEAYERLKLSHGIE